MGGDDFFLRAVYSYEDLTKSTILHSLLMAASTPLAEEVSYSYWHY